MLFNTKILPFKKYIFQNHEKTKKEKHSAAWLVHFTNTLTAFFLACGFFLVSLNCVTPKNNHKFEPKNLF